MTERHVVRYKQLIKTPRRSKPRIGHTDLHHITALKQYIELTQTVKHSLHWLYILKCNNSKIKL